MSNGCHNHLPPLFLLALFGASYFIYVYCYCFGAVKSIPHRIGLFILVNIFTTMFLWSFFATMWTDAGKVPDEYKFNRDQHRILLKASTDDERDAILEDFCERKNLLLQTSTPTGSIRYCVTCMHIKPDRAHHCSVCQTCLLKMDHHCPWVNNCIGFRNYKSFILLLFYTFLYCVYYVTSTIRHLIYNLDISRFRQDLPLSIGKRVNKGVISNHTLKGILQEKSAINFFRFGLATIMGLVTCGFLCYHLYLMCINETTMENVHPPHFVEDDMTFDLGILQNVVEVFGKQWYLWVLPVFSSVGPGHIFLIGRK